MRRSDDTAEHRCGVMKRIHSTQEQDCTKFVNGLFVRQETETASQKELMRPSRMESHSMALTRAHWNDGDKTDSNKCDHGVDKSWYHGHDCKADAGADENADGSANANGCRRGNDYDRQPSYSKLVPGSLAWDHGVMVKLK